MRGEDWSPVPRTACSAGSPPHARGRRHRPGQPCAERGITPACAGKTQCQLHCSLHFGGSPPHARGRLGVSLDHSPATRITPACAGKTHPVRAVQVNLKDHPRMRGEDLAWGVLAAVGAGSPPHARGRLKQDRLDTYWARITPACAGKTPAALPRCAATGDHPRMRGEDGPFASMDVYDLGSPPHARGRLLYTASHCLRLRITPACAGKTIADGTDRCTMWDHPRMRGEDEDVPARAGRRDGSPPHARGRQGPNQTHCRSPRITPACAGKTSTSVGVTPRNTDHPRMRGEDGLTAWPGGV